MARKADKELVDKAVDYIQGHYKFEDVLEELNLLDSVEPEGYNRLIMKCPFHGLDKTPSLKINTDLNAFNCFSCTAGGKIVHFYLQYKLKVLEEKTNYYQVIEWLLKKDPIMQLRIGATSIFKSERFDTTGLDKISLKRSISFSKKLEAPVTFIELSRRLKQEYPNSVLLYLNAISLMESGLNPKEIYKMSKELLEEQTEKDKLNKVDLDSLTGGDLFDK